MTAKHALHHSAGYLPMVLMPAIILRAANTRNQRKRLLLVSLFLGFNVLYLRRLKQAGSVSQQLKMQQLYTQSLEKAVDNLRGFKHDFSNILNTISGFVDANDISSLSLYMHQLNREFLRMKSSETVNSELKQHPLLYGVLLSKISYAETNGIDFSISIQAELGAMFCSVIDFSRIIGILLDNAMEAAATSLDRFVSLEITPQHGRLVIRIANAYNGEVDMAHIYRPDYSTKPGHTGQGLSLVKRIIQKYEKRGYAIELQTTRSDRVFCQSLKL